MDTINTVNCIGLGDLNEFKGLTQYLIKPSRRIQIIRKYKYLSRLYKTI